MKNTHKLCGAVLLAALGMAVVVPNATKAEQAEWTGAGVVEFEKDTTPNTVTPDHTTGPILTGLPTPEKEDFQIVAVTPLDFEKHAILADGRDEEYTVKPYNEAQFGDMEHFVDFRDVRSTTDHSYSIYGEMTQQFQQGTGVDAPKLDGASITYNNIRVGTNGTANAEKLRPEDASIVATTQTLTEDGGKVMFLNNTNPKKGFGQYKVVFGDRNNGTDDIKNSVKLSVPGDIAKSVGKYEAVITWTISDVLIPTA